MENTTSRNPNPNPKTRLFFHTVLGIHYWMERAISRIPPGAPSCCSKQANLPVKHTGEKKQKKKKEKNPTESPVVLEAFL